MSFRKNFPFWILLIILVVQRIVVLIVYNAEYTDNDQTLIWLIAKDYSNGEFHQPFMYGQDYNYMIEALLAVPLLWCNVPVEYALPAVTNFLAILPFISFAFWFKRQGKILPAVIMLAVPLLLPVSYALITSIPRGFVTGLFFFSFWPWLEFVKRLPVRYALYGFILAAALLANANVIFVAILLSGMEFLRSNKKLQTVLFAVAGTLVPVLLHVASKNWASNHGDQLIHHAWNLKWSVRNMSDALSIGPSRLLNGVVPFTERYAAIIWLGLTALVCAAWFRKNFLSGALFALICVLMFLSLGVNKVSDGSDSIFFPYARMFLAVPLVLALGWAESANVTRVRIFSLSLMTIATLFACWQATLIADRAKAEYESPPWMPLKIAAVSELKVKTGELHEFALQNSVVYYGGSGYPMTYGEQQNLFHAGEAWYDDFPKCALPEYERRKWRTEEFLQAPTTNTIWLAAVIEQWTRVDTCVGHVVELPLADWPPVHRVETAANNEEVFHALVDTSGICR